MSKPPAVDDMAPDSPAGGHDRRRYCGGKKRQGSGTCTRPAGWGTDHPGYGACKLHGGSTSNGKKAAAKQEAVEKVQLFGARRDVHPAEALLELVQWTAGEVDYWRQEVRALEREELTWGVTRVKEGGDDRGKTEEAKPNIAYAMLTDASNRLASYAAAALKAGVEERRVQLAENAGAVVAGVMQRALRAIFEQLVGALAEHEDAAAIVQAVWPQLVSEIVPRELRALAPPA